MQAALDERLAFWSDAKKLIGRYQKNLSLIAAA